MKIILMALLLFSCSHLNEDSQNHYKSREGMRHGVVPRDLAGPSMASLGPLDPDKVARGQVIYKRQCLECHGEKGLGNGPRAAEYEGQIPNLKLTLKNVPHFDFFISLSEWKGTMPGWKEVLTESERAELVQYLKSLLNEG